MFELRQAIADGWRGREAAEYTAWRQTIDAIVVPIVGCPTSHLPAGYDYTAAFRSGLTASEVADVVIASAWSFS